MFDNFSEKCYNQIMGDEFMRADNQAKNKIKNKNLILKKIIMGKNISRTGLTAFTGLTKMTVTNLVNELCEDNLIVEQSELVRQSVGRNPIILSAKRDNHIIGIYLNRDYVNVCMGNICGEILEEIRTPLCDETKNSISEKICASIDMLIKKHRHVLGIGISAIGPVDSESGVILNPPNFFDITNYNIKEFLSKKYNLPVYIDNDMNTSAIAEKYWGLADNVSDYVYLGASNGIGAGIVMGGKLTKNAIGEIGHVSININGEKCRCGNRGCLEMYASIEKDYDGKNSDEKCAHLASGAITLMNLFNPEAIFLGHRIPMLGDDAPQKIKEYMSGKYLTASTNDVQISFSKFMKNTPIYGAVAIFIERHTF